MVHGRATSRRMLGNANAENGTRQSELTLYPWPCSEYSRGPGLRLLAGREVPFIIALERLTERRYVLLVAKYPIVVTSRDLFLTVVLIEHAVWANSRSPVSRGCSRRALIVFTGTAGVSPASSYDAT